MSDMILFSMLADAMFSAALLVLWLVQREARHALYWGLGQLSMGILVALWYWQQQGAASPGIPWGLRVFLSLGVVCYIQGTLHVLRRPMSWWNFGGCFLALLVFFAVGAVLVPNAIQQMGAVLMASGFLWAGYQLGQVAGPYRWVGCMLAIRGALNLVIAFQLFHPQVLSSLYGVAAVVKITSMLILLYVVQHEVRERFPNAMRFLAEGLWIHDRHGKILFANPACARLFAWPPQVTLQGRQIQEFITAVSDAGLDTFYQRLSDPAESFPLQMECLCTDRQGRPFSIEALVSPYWQHGELLFMVQLRDISARKRQEQLLQLAANVDDVTELASRYALNEQLRTLLRHDAEPVACALIFMDLDHFKRINDSLGHMLGDQLLHGVAERLRQLVTPAICVARFGGDEFVIMLTHPSAERACDDGLVLAEQIHEAFRRPFALGAMEVVVTISTGMAVYPTQAQDADMLL